MDYVTITELRLHIADWVGRAEAGEEIVILRGGQPVARIVPVENRREAAERRLAGLRASAIVGDVVSPVGEGDWEAPR